jgi:hypothetical protein
LLLLEHETKDLPTAGLGDGSKGGIHVGER